MRPTITSNTYKGPDVKIVKGGRIVVKFPCKRFLVSAAIAKAQGQLEAPAIRSADNPADFALTRAPARHKAQPRS
jgi:hypothetical protein